MIGILTEKPSQARNFAAALGGMKGTFNGEAYVITNARGHLYGYAMPEKQVPTDLQGYYKSWKIENLPWDESIFKWKRIKAPSADSFLKAIKDTMASCDEVCIATDDDPTGEGELIAWEIFDELNIGRGKKFSRMYFVDESKPEIQKAFKNRKALTTMEQDMDFVKARYRCQWDFLSMQFTRIATLCGDGRSPLRQGRLKSSMVLLVGDQLKKIASYQKVPFYQNRFKDENGNIFSSEKEPTFPKKTDVPKTYTSSPVVVDSKSKKSTPPPKLIDLATLSSRLAGRVPAKTVLATYQKMYEAQVVSYPRTEDKYITPEQFKQLLPLVDNIASVVGVDTSILTHRQPRSTHVKTGCAHGANRPGTNVPKSLAGLDSTYGKGASLIYEMLAKNFLSMFAEDYEYEQQKGHLQKYPDFKGTANVPLSMGWHAVSYDADDEAVGDVSKGLGKNADPFVYEGFPPKPTAPTMRWLMKQLEQRDVGTGATRTSIYAEVIDKSKGKYPLLDENKGKLALTQYGEMSYRLLPGTHIGDIGITERLMKQMRQIAKGEFNPNDGLREMRQMVKDDIATMTKNSETMRKELGVVATFEKKEKCTGTWNGKEVSFTRTWGGHRFTDEECEKLLNGEEITIEMQGKDGGTYEVTGALANQEYNGHKYVGFEKRSNGNAGADDPAYYKGTWKGKNIRFKRNFRGHEFTDEECQKLLAGETLTVEGLVAKSGKVYSVYGQLAELEFNGHKYVGFNQEGFAD